MVHRQGSIVARLGPFGRRGRTWRRCLEVRSNSGHVWASVIHPVETVQNACHRIHTSSQVRFCSADIWNFWFSKKLVKMAHSQTCLELSWTFWHRDNVELRLPSRPTTGTVLPHRCTIDTSSPNSFKIEIIIIFEIEIKVQFLNNVSVYQPLSTWFPVTVVGGMWTLLETVQCHDVIEFIYSMT